MIRTHASSPAHTAAIRRIKAWTRLRFTLSDDIVVFVAEVACGLPGCPPLETIVTFWTTPDQRHAFKVFKKAVEVVEDDLPPAFMKNALLSDPESLSCC